MVRTIRQAKVHAAGLEAAFCPAASARSTGNPARRGEGSSWQARGCFAWFFKWQAGGNYCSEG